MAIVSRPNIKVKTSETFESQNFRIESSPEAFRILSDGLYSNKIKAVIRELSTNAVDSLVDAGTTDFGFEVHLPTSLSPEFYIRDFGTGLSHEDVVGLYTTYFSSNKTDSNDFTGQLGLGSKSPFAYTDSFTVTSFFNGMKRIYNAHISESGYPAISLLSEGVCSDKNGIEIRFPVKGEDVYNFESEAVEVYSHFNILPSFIDKTIEIEKPEVLLEGEGWYIYESKARGRSRQAFATMGNIAYPISQFDSENPAHTNLLETGIVIDFNIGDLHITPSRESLSMTKRTIQNLKSRLDIVISEIKTEVQSYYDKCDDLWDARCKTSELFGSWSSPLYHLGSVCKASDITYKGETIVISNDVLVEVKGTSIWRFSQNYNKVVSRESLSRIKCNRDLKIFVDDLSGAGAYSRCQEWVKNNGVECYLVRFTSDGVKNDAKVSNEFLESTGMNYSMLSLVSELPKPVRFGRRSAGTGVRKDKVLKFDHSSSYSSKSDHWDSCEVDFDNGGVYVEISRYNLVDHIFDLSALRSLRSDLNLLLDDGGLEIYGVKTASINRYKESDNWIELKDYAKEQLEIHKEKHEAVIRMEVNSQALGDVDFHWKSFEKLEEHLSQGALKSFCLNIKEMEKSLKGEQPYLSDVKNIAEKFELELGYEIEPILTTEKLESLYEEFFEKYEILKITFAAAGYWSRGAYDSFDEEHWKIVAKFVEERS
jgi:hypothetical protein